MCPGVIGAKASPTLRARWMESEVWIVWWVNLAFISVHIFRQEARSLLQNSIHRMKRAMLSVLREGVRVLRCIQETLCRPSAADLKHNSHEHG